MENSDEGALNNLGIHAQNLELDIKRIEYFRKSAATDYTLSMANLGYAFLNAGFIKEAEDIAKKAMKLENPHKNIHSLIVAIKNKNTEQNKTWEKLREKSYNRQK